MTSLAQRQCEACTAESTPVPAEEQADLLASLPGWSVAEEGGVPMLVGSFRFENYERTMQFVNTVAQLAEDADHHPRMVVEWGNVSVSWWTHTINGLHLNDFIMAARTSEAA